MRKDKARSKDPTTLARAILENGRVSDAACSLASSKERSKRRIRWTTRLIAETAVIRVPRRRTGKAACVVAVLVYGCAAGIFVRKEALDLPVVGFCAD